MDPDGEDGEVRGADLSSVVLGAARLLGLDPVRLGNFNDSVLRPAWNLRNAANAAASLAVVPDPLPLGASPGSEDFAASLTSGGVLLGTGMTCLTGVGTGGGGLEGEKPGCTGVTSRSRGAGDPVSPEPGGDAAVRVGVESSCGRCARSFSGGAPHGCHCPPALNPWNWRGAWGGH